MKSGAIAAALTFAAFVVAKGTPSLRHDWNWPIERLAIPSFFNESIGGWLPVGFGVANTHPTTYLIALPLTAAMWVVGPLTALALLAFATGYCSMRAAAAIASRLGNAAPAAIGAGIFALFNPWVYNEVVAGHLVMVLAYSGLIGLLAEMVRGRDASPVRLALWLVLIEAQLQFFIVATVASVAFALTTKKWLPVAAAAVVALPTAVGLIADRGALLQTPYSVQWQANQSLSPVALLSLGGYFPGYADRLGVAAQIAIWTLCALALAGVLGARRHRAVRWAAVAAGLVYLCALGVHGPLDAVYEWTVRSVPESGVFRELYDFGGVFAALLIVLASAATGRAKALGYLALLAGAVLPITWLFHPPSDLWVGAQTYPHPVVAAPPFSRVALLPAFQPLRLRTGEGDGADPDAIAYPGHVAALNEYLPAYPVDMALAQYEQSGDSAALRALGVSRIVARPWLVSRSNGEIGLAASSLGATVRPAAARSGDITGAAPLISACTDARIVASVDRFGPCDIFFGDAPGYAAVTPLRGPSDSIDPAVAWIDAPLAFARMPALAQGIGGVLTQSKLATSVTPGAWLLAYVHGRLTASGGGALAAGPGIFTWVSIPPNVDSVACAGLCELVAESRSFPAIPLHQPVAGTAALPFDRVAPWLYRVHGVADVVGLVRLNERYDPGWIALRAWHVLPHVRVALAANGWITTDRSSRDVFLVQVTAFLQQIAELAGVVCVLSLLKALVREPTKRV
ncbi:MAG TPA: hypothetical protein VKR56_14730 [Candidatus Cybelea sp.]|nr:hypothetical protein [Candidatus Cybelea sp.]